jgi:GNAT superfamily N-acetyltransferase
VDSFGIHADRRRQGIGRGLLEYAQSWAKHQGATRLQLTVWEFNADAVAFYESLGYETYSRNLWKTL